MDDYFANMVTKGDLLEIWRTWFRDINPGLFDANNIGWDNEYRDIVVEIMKIRYKYEYLKERINIDLEKRRVLKYYDPLTRDFHVVTFTGVHACESISIYCGSYNIPANNLNHPYHKLR
jgi:hypothetical protein